MSELNYRTDMAAIVPSLNPDQRFVSVIEQLIAAGFRHVIAVDDGSDEAHQACFETVAAFPECTVLHHGVNKGKGRALKTAFTYVLEALPEVKGVITADGDGQHTIPDIISCSEAMLQREGVIVLGCRNFYLPDIPPRNRFGNRLTSAMFRICCGIKLSDTQTGLRAIPTCFLERFCAVDGERFEYETNMLLQMKRQGIPFIEQPIATVYDPNDYSTHYNPIKDSWRIFKVMFKFMMSSLLSMLIDLGVFTVVLAIVKSFAGNFAELLATVLARAVSSFFNFNANNKAVFRNQGNYKRAMIRYYCLAIPQMLISAALVKLINDVLGNHVTILATLIKAVVDTALFFISFKIQREWVFSEKK